MVLVRSGTNGQGEGIVIHPTGKIVVVVDGIGWRWAKRYSTNGTNCISHRWYANVRECVAAAMVIATSYQITYGGME